MFEETDRKICIICSKGTLDMAYPGLILANAALMEGVDVSMFFTFWGLSMISKKHMDQLKFTPLGNPAMEMRMGVPNMVGMLPGMTGFATSMMKKEIEALDFPPVSEYLEMITDAGGRLYACKMSADMFELEEGNFMDEIEGVIGAMEFIEMSEDAQDHLHLIESKK